MTGAAEAAELPIWIAALLGAVQGVTEFLPVSSSGHLNLAQAWLGVDPEVAGLRFNVAVHAATLVAVIWHYRNDLRATLVGMLRHEGSAVALTRAVVVGTLPLAIVLVPAIKDSIVTAGQSVRFIGACLLATAVILWLAERRSPKQDPGPKPAPDPDPDPGLGGTSPAGVALTLRIAVLVGLAQLFAVLPGVSRSGSTIAAAMLLGIDRPRAARLSFFLMIPAVGAATVLELRHALESTGPAVAWTPIAVGFLVSLVVGLASLQLLVRLLAKGRLAVFSPYLLLIGLAAIVLGA